MLLLGNKRPERTILTALLSARHTYLRCPKDQPCMPVSVFASRIATIRAKYIAAGRSEATDWPVVVTTDDESPE